MNWIVIAVTDLERYLVAPQLDAIRTAALATGQADPFTETMHDRANYVRNRIAGRVQISATAYAVPPELVHQTALLIIEAMQGRIPMLELSEDQKRMISRAYDDLKLAGTADFPISAAADAAPAEVQPAGGISVVAKPTRAWSRDTMAGL